MSDLKIINRYSIAGLGANLIGIGIGRLAYVAMMPALIQGGWFSEQEASYLGAMTLIGYIFGAPLVNILVKYINAGHLIRIAMLICSFSYIGCAINDAPMAWFYTLRALTGVAGAMLMVLAPPLIVKMHRDELKSRVTGVVFSGLGIGVMLSGTLIPFLIFQSIATAWLGLGIISLLVTLITWSAWGTNKHASSVNYINVFLLSLSRKQIMTLALILIAYSFNAIGYLPHTLFWVDYIVRELGMSIFSGGFFWAVFGVGAMVGPILTGLLGDKFGIKTSLLIAFTLKGVGVAIPLLNNSPVAIFLSSLLVGIFTPSTVALVSVYTLECVGYKIHTKAWSMMTLSFAISQALAGSLMAFYTVQYSSYSLLFLISTSALAVSVLCIALTTTNKTTLTI